MKNREIIREQLLKLAESEKLTPNAVVSLAQSPNSPLHELFEWNDTEAARKFRLNQARDLIASFDIKVTINRTEVSIQEFVRDPSKSEKEQGYIQIQSVEPESELAREFIQRELMTARTYVERTRRFSILLGIDKDIGSLSDRLEQVAQSLASNRKGRS